MHKKKLALVISSMRSGGAERVMANLANALVEQGYDITLILFTAPSEESFFTIDPQVKVLHLNCLSHHKNPLVYLKNMLYCLYILRKTVKSLNVQGIISFLESVNMAVLVATIGLKIPVIISERIDPAFHRIAKFYAFGRLKIYQLCTKLVVQTKSVYDYFPTKFQPFMEIIPNPVSTSPVQKTNHADEVTHIVSVGRLTPQKNHAILIRAFAYIIEDYPNVQLTIIGDGEERSNLEQYIQIVRQILAPHIDPAKSIHLPGAIKNITPELLKADLFVFPSLYEGFPNALCEAMSIGLPVIASNVTGNRDLVVHNKNGLLFEAKDAHDLARQIIQMMDVTVRRRLASESIKVTLDYQADKIYARWINLIENVCV